MKNPIIPIIITVVLALGAGVLVFAYVSGADSRAMADQDTATVWVTEDVVPAGTTLAEAQGSGLITQATVPVRLQPAGALATVEGVNANLVTLADLPSGQVVLAAAVGAEVPEDWPIEVPEGQMAVTVLLDDPSKVGAFLRPGSHVAIFDTYAEAPDDVEGGGTPVFQTRALLEDVVVLAVGEVTDEIAESASSEAWNAQLVTLALTQEQAERLVHAIRTGALHFALLGENTVVDATEGVTDQNLFR